MCINNKKNSLFLLIALCVSSLICVQFLFCTNTGERRERVNPYDTEGTNWYPPVVVLDDSVITTAVDSTITLTYKVNDQNGTVEYVLWRSESAGIDTVDTLEEKTATTIEVYDTTIDTTITRIDTVLHDSLLVDSTDTTITKQIVIDSVYLITVIDSITENVRYAFDSTSDDTSYILSYVFPDTNAPEDTTFIVYKKYPFDTTIDDSIFDSTITLDSTFYSYTIPFQFSSADTITLFAAAVDDDSITSVQEDSVIIQISD